jgi:hypothetical protein
MKMFISIRQKTAAERFAMLLSLLVHAGLAWGFVYTIHGSMGSAVNPAASQSMIVNLLREQDKVAMPERKLLSAADSAQHASATEIVKMPDLPSDRASHLPAAQGLEDGSTASLFNRIASPPPYYFQPAELTEQPEVAVDIASDLSAILASGLSQMAVLDLLINESGDIDDVVVEDSSLPEPAQQLIRDAFAKTKFRPGKVAGMPVKSMLKIEVVLEGATVENISKKAE